MIKVDVNKITVTVKGREVTLSEKEHYSHKEYIMQVIQKAFVEMKKNLQRYGRLG